MRATLCLLLSVLIAACGQKSPGDPDGAATGISRTAPDERSTPERQRRQLTDSDLQSFRDFISGSEIRKASQPTQNPFFERFHTDGRWEAQYAWTDITECAGTWSARLKDEELLQICVAVAECSGRELRQGFEECRTAAPDYGNARMEIAPLGQEAFLEGESPTVSVNPID